MLYYLIAKLQLIILHEKSCKAFKDILSEVISSIRENGLKK